MKIVIAILLVFSGLPGVAQRTNWTKLIINPQLKVDTSFSNKWSYPWYIIKHADGHFENTISDSVKTEDTARQYYTAACINSQNGNHHIDYCKASTYNDDVELHFSGTPPGYNEDMLVVIRNGYFSGQYNLGSMVLESGVDKQYQILSQTLVLKSKPVYDSMITGEIEIRFREKTKNLQYKLPRKAAASAVFSYSKVYVLKGRFHTPLNSVIDIE